MTKNGGVAGYTEYFCYVLSGKLTNEDGSYLFNAVLVQHEKMAGLGEMI